MLFRSGSSIQAPIIKGGIIKGGRVESGHFAGGSINIGNGNFSVDSYGNLNAKSGTFEGTVYADKIEEIKIEVKGSNFQSSSNQNNKKLFDDMW